MPTERSSPSQPHAEPPPSRSRRPKRCPLSQSHFCKSLFPATHSPTRTLQSSAIRDGFGDRLVSRRKIGYTYICIYFKIKAPEPEVGTGLSILPRKGAGGAGQSQDAGQGSEADFSPGSAQRAGGEAGFATSRAAVHPPPGVLRISARLGAPGASNCLAAPPPSLEANSHSPWGFTFSPGPCRLPAPGQLQLEREEEGELAAGVTRDSCGEGRQGRRARGRASERGVPAAAAATPK